MLTKRLFRNNIEPNCSYCLNSIINNGSLFCTKLRRYKNNKNCKHFNYDPLKRVPKDKPDLPHFDKSEFYL